MTAKNSRNKQEFEVFKKEFKKWQDKLELNEYRVYFQHAPAGIDNYATINVNQAGMVATVVLNSELTEEQRRQHNVKQTAKHEAMHLLFWRMENLAICRYVTDSEVFEASEALARKLERVVN